jgi:hypothetical protein
MLFDRFEVQIVDMTAPLTDENQQLKFRKSLGGSIGVIFSAVILQNIARRLEISLSSDHGSRRASSTSTTRVLSAGDASSLADQVGVPFDFPQETSAYEAS